MDGHNATFELIKGDNGVFNVECNGEVVFERAKEGRFPFYHEIQLRVFRRFLKPHHLMDATREKWNRILEAQGLTWDQVFLEQAER